MCIKKDKIKPDLKDVAIFVANAHMSLFMKFGLVIKITFLHLCKECCKVV